MNYDRSRLYFNPWNRRHKFNKIFKNVQQNMLEVGEANHEQESNFIPTYIERSRDRYHCRRWSETPL